VLPVTTLCWEDKEVVYVKYFNLKKKFIEVFITSILNVSFVTAKWEL
jgi:hypothetical protein